MKLNPSQNEAVNTTGKNVLVFASAGGGKTTVLVSRLLKRIVNDRIPLDNILAMTFTNAAALNMKKRLEVRLKEAIKDNPDDSFIFEQLTKIGDAQISTIHAFCLNLIKEYYYVIGINKSVTNNILDDGKKALYESKAFDLAVKDFKELDVLKNALDMSLFSFDSLKSFIFNVIKTARTYKDPIKWFDLISSKEISSFNDLDTNVKKYYLEDLKALIKLASFYLDEMAKLETDKSDDLTIKSKEAQYLISLEDYSQLENALSTFITSIPNDKNEEYKYYRNMLKACFEDISSKLISERRLVKEYNDAIKIESLLLSLSKEVYLNFQKIKKDNNAIDFDDFEPYAYAILNANDGYIANKLKKQYQEIMIDEFQDTNESQFSIVSLFAQDNLFLVGDIKQSIYRFRHAKPDIMKRLKKDPSFHKIHIQNNYRSNTNIVEFNNHLFKQIMNIYSHDVDEKDLQITLDSQSQNNVDVRFEIAIGDDEKTVKARELANIIHRLHDEGKKFMDIAVLVKTHDEKKSIKDAFRQYNIPYFINDNEGYFTSLSIDIILSFMKYLINPSDKLSLISLLSSPLYGLSDDELCLLKDQYYRYEPFMSDYYHLKQLALNNQIDEIIYYILNINNYYSNYTDDQEKANVDFLLTRLDTYNLSNINEFIDYIESTKDFQKENANTISEDADVVKVMTIHTSKGLEFDTVILNSNHSNRLNESKSSVNVDVDMGICLSYVASKYKRVVSTIKRASYLAKENVEDLLESQRLLYVALTRAKAQLIILDSFKKEEDIAKIKYPVDSSLFYARQGFSSFIYSAMIDSPLMKCDIKNEIEYLDAYPKIIPDIQNIPSKSYDTTNIKDISPSSLEASRVKLNIENIASMNYGTKIHHIFECLDYSKEISENDILKIDNDLSPKTIESIMYFVNSDIIAKARQGQIHQEFSFYLKKDNVLTHGFMDFVAILDNEIILIDYKTDTGIKEEEFIKRYFQQLKAYEDVLVDIYHLKVSTYIYAISLSKFITLKTA